MEAADVHQRMATARKSFNNEVNTTFIEDLKNFVNTTLSEAQVISVFIACFTVQD